MLTKAKKPVAGPLAKSMTLEVVGSQERENFMPVSPALCRGDVFHLPERFLLSTQYAFRRHVVEPGSRP